MGLMSFPMRHKHCMWEADSPSARVCVHPCACERLYAYMYEFVLARHSTHALAFLCICEKLRVYFTSLCLLRNFASAFICVREMLCMQLCSQETCTSMHSVCAFFFLCVKNKSPSDFMHILAAVLLRLFYANVSCGHVCLWETFIHVLYVRL